MAMTVDSDDDYRQRVPVKERKTVLLVGVVTLLCVRACVCVQCKGHTDSPGGAGVKLPTLSFRDDAPVRSGAVARATSFIDHNSAMLASASESKEGREVEETDREWKGRDGRSEQSRHVSMVQITHHVGHPSPHRQDSPD